jgi:hypothetical protein
MHLFVLIKLYSIELDQFHHDKFDYVHSKCNEIHNELEHIDVLKVFFACSNNYE